MKLSLRIVSIVLLLLGNFLFTNGVKAQMTEPFKQESTDQQSDDPVNPCVDPFEPCPIDGGLAILLIAGVGYGIKKHKDLKRSSWKVKSL